MPTGRIWMLGGIHASKPAAVAGWPNFPGWTEADNNDAISLVDPSAFDTVMTITNDFHLSPTPSNMVVVLLPSAWDNAYGDWNIRFEFGGYNHTASRVFPLGVASASKPRGTSAGSLVGDGDDHCLWAWRGVGGGWIAPAEYIDVATGWAQGGWNGETPAKNRPDVYYGEMARESGVIHIRTYDDVNFTTQLGVDAISNAVGAGWSVDRILMPTWQMSGISSNHDIHVKMISITPNPWD